MTADTAARFATRPQIKTVRVYPDGTESLIGVVAPPRGQFWAQYVAQLRASQRACKRTERVDIVFPAVTP